MLAAYGAAISLLYGLLMNLWFWPFVSGLPEQIAFVAGSPVGENLAHWIRFTLITSLGYDIPRAVLTVVLILIAGKPVLLALRRVSRKAAFEPAATFIPQAAAQPEITRT
jgi:energy-coupling factor transport system substrate-specific component